MRYAVRIFDINKPSVVLVNKMDIKAGKVEEALAAVAVTNATTTTPVDLAVTVAAAVVVGSGVAVEGTRTGIRRGCGIEMFIFLIHLLKFQCSVTRRRHLRKPYGALRVHLHRSSM